MVEMVEHYLRAFLFRRLSSQSARNPCYYYKLNKGMVSLKLCSVFCSVGYHIETNMYFTVKKSSLTFIEHLLLTSSETIPFSLSIYLYMYLCINIFVYLSVFLTFSSYISKMNVDNFPTAIYFCLPSSDGNVATSIRNLGLLCSHNA